jgi:hypothetical protein
MMKAMDIRPRTSANATNESRCPVAARLGGGPTVLLEIGGLRLLADPVFPWDAGSMSENQIILLSQYPRAADGDLRAAGSLILASAAVAPRFGGVVALPPWHHLTLLRPDGGCLRITGTPAAYGSDGMSFLLTAADTPTVYVGTSADVVAATGRFAPIDLALVRTASPSLDRAIPAGPS